MTKHAFGKIPLFLLLAAALLTVTALPAEEIPIDLVALQIPVPTAGADAPYALPLDESANYDGGIEWLPSSASEFIENQVYTAMVCLEAMPGWLFTEQTVVTINGRLNCTVELSDGLMIVTQPFSAVMASPVTGLKVVGELEKTVYAPGDLFDPAGLTVQVTCDDPTAPNPVFSDYNDYVVTYENGDRLRIGDTYVTLSAGAESAEIPVRVVADNPIQDFTCPDVTFGDRPSPSAFAASGAVQYSYSGAEDGVYGAWDPENGVGTYWVKASVEENGGYKASEAIRSFRITARSIADCEISPVASARFTGTAVKPTPTVTLDGKALTQGADIAYAYENNVFAGDIAKIIVSGIGNYTGEKALSFTIAPVDQTPAIISTAELVEDGEPLDLTTLVSGAKGSLSFAVSDNSPASLGADGRTLRPLGNAGETVSVTVSISPVDVGGDQTAEYNAYTGTILVTISEKDKLQQTLQFPTATLQKVYTDADFTVAAVGAAEGSIVTYASSDPSVASVETDSGKVTIRGAGAAVITATASETDDCAEASAACMLTVEKGTITVTAENLGILTGDLVPTPVYTVTGLKSGEALRTEPVLAYATKPNMWKSGTVTIKASGAAAPDGDNYGDILYVDGTLTITKRPGSDSSGSIDAPTADKTGEAETVTTTATDGTTTTVETKRDGTVTETIKTTGGTTVVVVANAIGHVTEVEAKISVEDAQEAAATASFVTLPVDVPVSDEFREAPVVEIILPRSVKTVQLVIPVDLPTIGTVAVQVKKDGSEEIIKTSVPTERGIAFVADGSVSAKIIDNSKAFDDVAHDDWSADAVTFVTSRELFNGTDKTSFAPALPMTRQMLTTVLARLDGEDTTGDAYAKGMAWAVERGISDGSAPAEAISREQLAVMLHRYAGKPSTAGSLHFTDANTVSSFAYEAICWAVENGILTGKDGGILDPQGNATRAEVATMLMRLVTNLAS